ncbi:hypothetical protein QSJ19_07140 [Gordonia sp. ABSL11-1]|uniref:rhomboid-like protein n=1 Tax=Gordonia sp. ABSL11-1 TaxID=3053924 RepID=UPI00257332EE|nr:rhomboid-like protein [Gordonia sp. ABSL11-1]MDL9945373.1 hypothetical protein [Gordonia sp. ABSL11-1]
MIEAIRARTPRRWFVAVWRYLRSAPLAFLWLAVLLVTTIVQRTLTPHELDRLLGERSTNLHHLSTDPLDVLVTSLFWIDGAYWLPYLILFCLFHRPAERWLGSPRWVIVGLSAHVIATYLSEGLLGLAIRNDAASTTLINTTDVGVSYFLAAIVGVLTYHIAYPWRWIYLAGILGVYALPLLVDVDFTEIGHLTSLLIGLAWYPITRHPNGPPPWDPLTTARRLGRLGHSGASVRHKNS